MKHLKIICANPTDTLEVMGFNPRATAPCFLITITDSKELTKAHRKMLKSDDPGSVKRRFFGGAEGLGGG